MEMDYFDICHRRKAKVRWMCKALKFSKFLDLEKIKDLINDKLTRIVRRKGELDEETIAQIGENLLLAKVAKQFIDRRTKPFRPRIDKKSPTNEFIRDFDEKGLKFSYEESLCPIYKEKHYGMRSNPSILFPGFLPDGNEAYFLLRKCFLRFGSVYYFNYQTTTFYKETVFHQIYDTIRQINSRQLKNMKRAKPFLVATSFGCHILTNFMRWLHETGREGDLQIAGLVIISPVLTYEDVVDPSLERQNTLVGRAVANLCAADENDPIAIRKSMQKAKSIFMKMFTSGRDLMKFEKKDLIPIFAIEDDVLDVFRKEVEEDDGYFLRFMELKRERQLTTEFLSPIPTLVLLAENEGDVLVSSSPSYRIFSNISELRKIFPNGMVEIVHSNSETRKVTHSDLIFQANRFAEHLDHWLRRVIA